MLKIGFDGGYGNTEAVASNGRRIEVPSVVGSGFKREFSGLFGENRGLSTDNVHVRIDGKDYFVGTLAHEESVTASAAFDQNKINHPNNRIIIAATTAMIMKNEKEDIVFVSCLPYSDYNDQKDELKKYLQDFRAEVILFDGEKEVYRDVRFRHVGIFAQGAAAVYSILEQYREYLSSRNVTLAVADIGMKTLDVVVVKITDRIRILESLSFGLDTGISLIHEALSKAVQKKTGLSHGTPDLDYIIRNNGKWQEHDFSAEIGAAKLELKRVINDEINKRWKSKRHAIARTFLVGGGGEYLFNEFSSIQDNVELAPDPRFANALGCLKVADTLEEIFQEKAALSING
jgi:plasmid segregation protein ParM